MTEIVTDSGWIINFQDGKDGPLDVCISLIDKEGNHVDVQQMGDSAGFARAAPRGTVRLFVARMK